MPTPRTLLHRAAARSPLPEGALSVGAGLLLSGVTAYGFLSISSHALGPARYAPLSVLWVLVFVAAPGFYLPVEQEVGRAISARRVLGVGGRPVIARAALVAAGLAAAVVLVALAASPPIVSRLFNGDRLLFAGFVLAVGSYLPYFLLRGVLAGHGRFTSYGVLIGLEGAFRVAAAIALTAVGLREAGLYGLAVALPCLVASTLVLRPQRGLLTPGPPVRWGELSGALGLLLAGSVLAQLLINVGPLAVKVLAPADDPGAAGRFLNGLVIARIPAYLFQAVQASLLPKLAAQAAARQMHQFRTGLARLLVALAGIVAVAVVANVAVGPPVVRILFGPGFRLSRADLGLLAAGSGAYMCALALAQGLIALTAYRESVAGWLGGIVAFAAVTAAGRGLLLRVELGLLLGATTSVALMGALLLRRLGREPTGTPG